MHPEFSKFDHGEEMDSLCKRITVLGRHIERTTIIVNSAVGILEIPSSHRRAHWLHFLLPLLLRKGYHCKHWLRFIKRRIGNFLGRVNESAGIALETRSYYVIIGCTKTSSNVKVRFSGRSCSVLIFKTLNGEVCRLRNRKKNKHHGL